MADLASLTLPIKDESTGVVTPTKYDIPSGGDDLYFATYGSTTSAEIEAAYQDGKAVYCVYGERIYPLARRASATSHIFSIVILSTVYQVSCEAGTWSNRTVALSVATAYTGTPAALGTASAGSSPQFARGDHVHPKPSASDVGAIAAPSSPTSGQFLVYNGSAWTAQTVPNASGVSF